MTGLALHDTFVRRKHRENRKTLPFKNLFCCQYVQVVFTKNVTIITVTITTVTITTVNITTVTITTVTITTVTITTATITTVTITLKLTLSLSSTNTKRPTNQQIDTAGFFLKLLRAPLKKSSIRETKHLLTDADSSPDTTVGWIKNTQKKHFFGKTKKKSSKTQKLKNV